MNFCVAILVLNVEEKEQHFHHVIMLYNFQKGKNATQMGGKKDLYSVWKRICDCLCQK